MGGVSFFARVIGSRARHAAHGSRVPPARSDIRSVPVSERTYRRLLGAANLLERKSFRTTAAELREICKAWEAAGRDGFDPETGEVVGDAS